MSEDAAKQIRDGLFWFGFWLMIGLSNFGESRLKISFDENSKEEIQIIIDELFVSEDKNDA